MFNLIGNGKGLVLVQNRCFCIPIWNIFEMIVTLTLNIRIPRLSYVVNVRQSALIVLEI